MFIGYLKNTSVWEPPIYIDEPSNLKGISFNSNFKNIDPFNNNIEAGKNTYTYDAHTYHTKVPPQGIEEIIKHYTNENDVVLDPFCGSGMTGVAATNIGRQVILSDLSPAASFIAYNYVSECDPDEYLFNIDTLIKVTKNIQNELYNTTCEKCGKSTPMLYQVWSYGIICPHCNKEIILWDVARDEKETVRESKIRIEFDCSQCGQHLYKRNLQRTIIYPVQIGYKCCVKSLKEQTKNSDKEDIEKNHSIENTTIPYWYPDVVLPDGINTRQAIRAGITSIDKLYTKRALYAYSALWKYASEIKEIKIRSKVFFTLTSLYQRISLLSEFRFWGGSGNIANYNVPSIINEQNVFAAFYRKAKTIYPYLQERRKVNNAKFNVSVCSATNLVHIKDNTIDFVFTDPPFGANINYSEMNFIWESWLGVFTNNKEEAIINKVQNKSVNEYEVLLTKSFREIYRVLKPNSWACIVFHNSSEKVWISLVNAIANSGLYISNTQLFNKKHGTFKQFVSENAVGYDLIIHCKKSIDKQANNEVGVSIKDYFSKIKERLDDYKVKYLHVDRNIEVDYRKMYSEWLSENIKFMKNIVSFEKFTEIIKYLIGDVND